jgi:hypothetical protein
MTPAERSAAFRARRKAAGLPPPVHRRSKQQKQWQDAVETLVDLLDNYLLWRDTQGGLTDSAIADRLEEVLLRDLLARLAEAELPKRFRARLKQRDNSLRRPRLAGGALPAPCRARRRTCSFDASSW